MRRLVYVCPAAQAIDSVMLPAHLSAPPISGAPPASEGDLNLPRRTAALESQLIREALARAEGNHSSAAKLLGISRNGLAMKIKRLGRQD